MAHIRLSLIILLSGFWSANGIIARNRVIISKKLFVVSVVTDKGDTLATMPCTVGLNCGQKKKKGDMKTPEGTFRISMIQNAKKWTHDFKDGAGKRIGAYGPWFIRLTVPRFNGIGIHGTCFPESIGSRCSEGCIRLLNEDLQKLVGYIKKGDVVIIEKDDIQEQ